MNNINRHWVFGAHAGLDFSTSVPTPSAGTAISTSEGCAAASDRHGNLLFYTDGITVWNGSHNVVASVPMLEGDPSSTQSATIVPDPGNSQRYYIFTVDGSSSSGPPIHHFNGGRLDVSFLPWQFTPLSALMTMPSTTGLSPAEKVTAIQHRNCRDFWIVTVLQGVTNDGHFTERGPGLFRVFLLTAAGIAHTGDMVMTGPTEVRDVGYLRASPDGRWLALANGRNANVLIYPFNDSTGVVQTSAKTVIPILGNIDKIIAYGVEFSPSSQFLYYGDIAGNVHQFDLLTIAPGLVTPAPIVHTFINPASGYVIGALQRGPDNRIYVAKDRSTELGAILSPDTLGAGCNPVESYLTLPAGALCHLGLPNAAIGLCVDDCDCGCGCNGCNDGADEDNAILIERARGKFRIVKSSGACADAFSEECKRTALPPRTSLAPCFYFHWADGADDRIEEHDTEVFYLTVCNPFRDVRYEGLRITAIRLVPSVVPRDKAQIVPDRLVSFDCLEPCSCQTREFALITRATDTAGNYELEVEYCFDRIVITDDDHGGTARFRMRITQD